MEKAVEELKKMITFKDTTEIGDVVLMVNETEDQDEAPLGVSYAVITDFVRDETKRDEWWHVHFSFLTIPPQPQVIILQREHFTGAEIFTMGGKKVFIKAVDFHFGGGSEPSSPEPKEKPRLRVLK